MLMLRNNLYINVWRPLARLALGFDKYGCYITHWGRDKMDAISQTTFWSAFCWTKMFEFRLEFHWSLFLRAQLTIFQHLFRWWLGAAQATSHYLNQWWLDYRRIYASLGLDELTRIPLGPCKLLQMYCMISSNHMYHDVIANIFSVTCPLWGESTADRWFTLTEVSDADYRYFVWCEPQQMVEQTVEMPIFGTSWGVLWRHCNDIWQVSAHLCCPDICQMWTWCLIYKRVSMILKRSKLMDIEIWLRNLEP